MNKKKYIVNKRDRMKGFPSNEAHRRKLFNDALTKNEKRFRTLFEKALEGIILCSPTGKIVDANPKALEMFGYDYPSLLTRSMSDLVDPEDSPRAALFSEGILTGETSRMELRLIRSDGSRFTAEIVGQLLQKDLTMMMLRNVTLRRMAEEKLALSEERYALAQRAANIGSWDWDVVTGNLQWSEQIEPMFGFEKGKFHATYEAFLKCVHPDDRRLLEKAVKNAVYHHKEYALEHRIIWPDGTIRWVSENGDVYYGEAGKPVRMIGIVQDITNRRHADEELKRLNAELEYRVNARTAELQRLNEKLTQEIDERKQIEAALKESEKMLRGVFNGISDPLILFGKNLEIKNLNLQAQYYYQIEMVSDMLGKPCYKALRHRSGICDGCKIPSAIASGKEQVISRKGFGGQDRLEQVYLYPIKDANGNQETTLLRVHDISEKANLEKQLIQSEKLASIGVLVSGIAHEINNPNNFVTFNIPILRDYLNGIMPIVDEHARKHPGMEMFYMPYPEFRDDIFKLLDNMEHGSRRIRSIVSDLKDFSRANPTRKSEKIDIRPVIDKVVSFTRSKVKRSVKTFDVQVPETLPKIVVDPQPLEQVLINLLINAAQSFNTPDNENSTVHLDVSITNTGRPQLRIRVRDNGCGMDEKTMGKIFDPFFTTKPAKEGTGLGMYICHNLVQNMGGKIEVKSRPDVGSEFTVILDIDAPATDAEIETPFL